MKKKILLNLLIIPFVWTMYLIACLFKRDLTKIAFGCHTRLPTGNVWAFFKDVVEKAGDNDQVFWIAKDQAEFLFLKRHNAPVLKKKSLRGIMHCLTSGYYCYSQYVNDVSFAFSGGTKKVNLWHGTPMKKIERDITTGIYSIRYKYKFIFSFLQPWVFAHNDIFFVSCPYEKDIFKRAFAITEKEMYCSFSPRLLELKGNIHSSSISKRDKENKNILICPTFRDTGEYDYSTFIDFNRLNRFGIEKNINFWFKLHPSDKSIIPTDTTIHKNITVIDNSVNVYSLLESVDYIITDYSSIFCDAIALDIPFIFYCPDIEEYNLTSRQFYFDAARYFPDVVVYNQQQLEDVLGKEGGGVNKVPAEFIPFSLSKDYPMDAFFR